jgi:hypothetical protein
MVEGRTQVLNKFLAIPFAKYGPLCKSYIFFVFKADRMIAGMIMNKKCQAAKHEALCNPSTQGV